MNSSANGKNSSSGTVRNVIGAILFVLVCIGLYYLYNFLYGSVASKSTVTMLSGTIPMTQIAGTIATNSKKYAASTNLTGVMDGGQYSTSMWVYVADTKGFSSVSTPLAHLMEISDDRFDATAANVGNTLLFIGLNPKNGSLVVRQSTSDTAVQINNNMPSGSPPTSTLYPLDSLIGGYTTGTTFTSNDSCDIMNGIEYQRWILVTTVANGRTLDVYVDGKLARSCVYKANYALGSNGGKATAYFGYNNGGNLKGFFSDANFYNYSLTPDAVWAIYQAGPGGPTSLYDFFANLFGINVSFQKNAISSNCPSVSSA